MPYAVAFPVIQILEYHNTPMVELYKNYLLETLRAIFGYARLSLGKPADDGNAKWTYHIDDHTAGSGLIKNTASLTFDVGDASPALVDWGWVSGIAIVDSGEYGTGNLLMHAALDNPRVIYAGDTVKFDVSALQISFK